MIVCTAFFFPAGLIQTEGCRYATLRYPNGPAVLDEVLEVFAEGLDFKNSTALKELKIVANAKPFSVLLTRCANENLVDSLGDEVVGMMVSDTVSSYFSLSVLKLLPILHSFGLTFSLVKFIEFVP